MKKAALFCVFVLVAFFGYAQELPTDKETGKITFTEVVAVDGATKEELYRRGREWFVKTFNNAEAVLQMDDKTSGQMIGKGWSTMIVGSGLLAAPVKVWYMVDVSVKDGRYKYVISDFEIQDNPSQYNNYSTAKYPMDGYGKPAPVAKNQNQQKKINEKHAFFKGEINKIAQGIIISLVAAMQDQNKKADW